MSDCDRFLIRPWSLCAVRDHVQHSPRTTNTHTHTHAWTHAELGDGVKERVSCQTTEDQRCTRYHTCMRVCVCVCVCVSMRLHRLLELSGALNHGCNGQHYRQRQQPNDECPSLRSNPDLLFCCDAQKSLRSLTKTHIHLHSYTLTHKQALVCINTHAPKKNTAEASGHTQIRSHAQRLHCAC